MNNQYQVTATIVLYKNKALIYKVTLDSFS